MARDERLLESSTRSRLLGWTAAAFALILLLINTRIALKTSAHVAELSTALASSHAELVQLRAVQQVMWDSSTAIPIRSQSTPALSSKGQQSAMITTSAPPAQSMEAVSKSMYQLGEPRGLYMGDGVVFCYVQPLEYAMFLESRDVGITPHLCRGVGWEAPLNTLFSKLVRPGDYVLDVGANVGYYTLLFSKLVGDGGRVKAVEANPRVHHLASSTVEIHGLADRTQVQHAAVYDKDGEVVHISTARDRTLNNRVMEGTVDNGSTGRTTAPVKTVTIDTLVKDWSRLDFVKIDVEGAEAYAFRGMKATLARFPNAMLVVEANTRRMGLEKAQQFYKEVQEVFPVMMLITGSTARVTSPTELLKMMDGDALLLLSNRKPSLFQLLG